MATKEHTRDLKMSDAKPSETVLFESKRGKVVGRNVAIALGIICLVLVASLGVVVYMVYSPTGQQTRINQLQTWLDGNKTLLSQTQTCLSGNVTALQNEVGQYNAYVADHHATDEGYGSLQDIANLQASTVWVNDQTVSQPASSYTIWTLSATYAGYVSIYVQSSSVSGTHVRVIYSAYGVNFNQEIVVNAGNTAIFPLLPSSSIQVEVGNGNVLNGATETVTITYYY
jgi:hypothetical protein